MRTNTQAPQMLVVRELIFEQYRKAKENAEAYPYVWASYLIVYGGFGLWVSYRYRKLRNTEDRVRSLQEKLCTLRQDSREREREQEAPLLRLKMYHRPPIKLPGIVMFVSTFTASSKGVQPLYLARAHVASGSPPTRSTENMDHHHPSSHNGMAGIAAFRHRWPPRSRQSAYLASLRSRLQKTNFTSIFAPTTDWVCKQGGGSGGVGTGPGVLGSREGFRSHHVIRENEQECDEDGPYNGEFLAISELRDILHNEEV
ncbi:hypothetical protein L6452_21817 [Arctium lappa]|uniref:Uncharacterized protein n=1 Tax=Arctium lappa TaxID=4217 RepID=A0ACB9AXH4_ARCLA|nr:hypothetical protein L6452_21817 [Arctium lappa]